MSKKLRGKLQSKIIESGRLGTGMAVRILFVEEKGGADDWEAYSVDTWNGHGWNELLATRYRHVAFDYYMMVLNPSQTENQERT